MQKGSKGLLKILKSHKDLQKLVLKADRDNLNDFRSSLEFSENFLESFKDTSEGEVKFKDSNEDFNENQFEVE